MKFRNLERVRSLAVVGATGIVGREFLEILGENKVRIPRLKLLASERSEGESLEPFPELTVERLGPKSFADVEVAFFSVPKEVGREYVPIARESGCLVVDDSSLFRMDPEVPLVIPQVNGHVLRGFEGDLVATPNCSATPVILCLKPLLEYGPKRVVVSTYQSVSGAGTKAFRELSEQTIALMNGREPDVEAFPHRIAFNCLPQIGLPLESGNTDEEEKIVRETRKVLGLPDLRISATAVRVPTFCGHGVSVNVEMDKPFGSVEEIRERLDAFPGLKVIDQPQSHIYPTNVECTKQDTTFVGRIRRDGSLPSGLNFWVITDNLRKGAALNSLEIIDTLYGYRSEN